MADGFITEQTCGEFARSNVFNKKEDGPRQSHPPFCIFCRPTAANKKAPPVYQAGGEGGISIHSFPYAYDCCSDFR